MHVNGFLHKLLSPVIHKKRLSTLSLFVSVVLRTKKLSVTELGRAIDLPIQERSGIRRADRFLSNKSIHEERSVILKCLAMRIIGDCSRPQIIVDWSEIPNSSNHVLRAALVAYGRALTLYEEVHPEKKLSNPTVEKRFLKNLRAALPEQCRPIIITDAGFHNKWFKEILNLKWDYIGRVRCGKKYCLETENTWHHYKELFSKARSTPKYVGKVKLGRKNPLNSHLYLFKGKKKGRSSLTQLGKKRRDTNSMDHRKSGKEPWVLASSLSGRSMEKRVIKIYKKRMQIEEAFRDLKSSRYGFGFENSYSKNRKRVEILLLITAIASFLAWLIGWLAEKNQLHYQFQSNTVKNRRVLSLFFLGCQVIKRKAVIKMITMGMIETAMDGWLLYA